MKRTLRLSIWIPLGAVLVLGPARAARAAVRPADASAAPGTVPAGINYQGRLVDNGFPVTATRSLTFRLYDAPTSGNLLWASAAQAVAVNQGIFGTTLSISTPALAGAAQKYLEVQVDNTVLSPREPLQAVPYALIAKSVEDNLALTNLTAGSSVTASAFFGDGSHLTGLAGSLSGGTAGYMAKWSSPMTLVLSNFWETASSDTVLGAGGLGVASSATASAFFGDGSHLTGIPSTGSFSGVYLPLSGGALNPGAGLALSGAGGTIASQSSATASAFFGDGSHLTGIAALSGGSAGYLPKWTGAASEGLSNFWETASSDTVLGPGGLSVNYGLAAGSITLTGAGGTITSASSATAAAFFGDGSHLTGIAALSGGSAGYLPKWTGAASEGLSNFWETASSDTALGAGGFAVVNAFSVGGSTLVVGGGNVGVGTASPATMLHMSSGTLTIDGNAATGLQVYGSTFVVNSSGNVGFGTSSPGRLLDMQSSAAQTAQRIWNTGSGISYTQWRNASGSAAAGIETGTSGTAFLNTTPYAAVFGNQNAYSAQFATNNTVRATIDAGGNLGVGTTSPAATLDVNGAAQFGSGVNKSTFSAAGGLTFAAGFAPSAAQDAATKNYVDTKLVSGGGPWTQAGAVVSLTTPGNNAVVQSTLTVQGNAFSVGGSTFVVTGGNVGIGTASPGRPLAIFSSRVNPYATNTYFGIDDIWVANFTPTSHNTGLAMAANANGGGGTVASVGVVATGTVSGSALVFQTRSDAAVDGERMRIDQNGYVGVGTSSPAATLDVYGGIASRYGTSLLADSFWGGFGDVVLRFWNHTAETVDINSNGTTFFNGGNVGVGTATPQTALDVNGAIRAGTTGAACSASLNGALRYNASTSNYELCSGAVATWLVLEPAYAWADVAASAPAVKGGRYLVNTSGGAVTLTLPAAPAVGDRVAIVDSGGAFATNNLTVARNGGNIMALAQDMTVSTNYVSFELVYDGATNGWRIK